MLIYIHMNNLQHSLTSSLPSLQAILQAPTEDATVQTTASDADHKSTHTSLDEMGSASQAGQNSSHNHKSADSSPAVSEAAQEGGGVLGAGGRKKDAGAEPSPGQMMDAESARMKDQLARLTQVSKGRLGPTWMGRLFWQSR